MSLKKQIAESNAKAKLRSFGVIGLQDNEPLPELCTRALYKLKLGLTEIQKLQRDASMPDKEKSARLRELRGLVTRYQSDYNMIKASIETLNGRVDYLPVHVAARRGDAVLSQTLAQQVRAEKLRDASECQACSSPLHDFRVTLPCGHSLHRDCAMRISSDQERCECGSLMEPATQGRVGSQQKPVHLRSPRCAGCVEEKNYYKPGWPSIDYSGSWPFQKGKGFLTPPLHFCGRAAKVASVEPVAVVRRVVPFPVIDSVSQRVEFWCAATYRPDGFSSPNAVQMKKGFVFGALPDSDYDLELSTDIYVFRASPASFKAGKIQVIQSEPVRGRSMEAAVWLAANGTFKGHSRAGVTGSLNGYEILLPQCWREKSEAFSKWGIVLSFPSLYSPAPLFNVLDAVRGVFGLSRTAVQILPKEPGFDISVLPTSQLVDEEGDVAMASDRALAADPPVPTARQLKLRQRRSDQKKMKSINTQINASGPRLEQVVKDRQDRNKVGLEELKKIRKTYLDARNVIKQAEQVAQENRKELIAQASDGSHDFAFMGKANYLRSVLIPEEGPVPMPDDAFIQKYTKQESVTYNMPAANSGTGVIILYPNHPTSLIGYHYVWNGVDRYIFERGLYTAQTLKDSYDYARRVSQVVKVFSNTISTTNFSLSGTFNAVTSVGTITEIPNLNTAFLYNGILANTVNPLDKLGNGLLSKGVACLSLPAAFGEPMTRLGDRSPGSVTVGNENDTVNAISDDSQSLEYEWTGRNVGFVVAANTQTTVFQGTKNIDSSAGLNLQYNLILSNIVAANNVNVNIQFTILDPFGNTIAVDGWSGLYVANAGQQISVTWARSYNTSNNALAGPVGAIETLVRITPTLAIAAGSLGLSSTFKAQVGARKGVNQPIQFITYSGLTANAVITVSGVSNFEMLPNPTLRQNLPVTAARGDIQELQYLRDVMNSRKMFGIRSIYHLDDYEAMKPYFAEIADVTIHEKALAYSGSDFIAMLKRTFSPILGKLAEKGANYIEKAVPALANRYLGIAASGDPVLSAGYDPRVRLGMASSKAYADDRLQQVLADRDKFEPGDRAVASDFLNLPFLLTPPPNTLAPLHDLFFLADLCARSLPLNESVEDGDKAYAADIWRGDRALAMDRVVRKASSRYVAFPVIIERADGTLKGVRLYLASQNRIGVDLGVKTPSLDGKYVHGWQGGVYPHAIGSDVYLFPISIDAFKDGRIQREPGPLVAGTSCEAAIWLVTHGDFEGLLPYAITGAVDAHDNVMPNFAFSRKLSALRTAGVDLAGDDESADIPLQNLRSVTGRELPEMSLF
jgi:hypothetical protein